MIDLYGKGWRELKPETISFNTVIDTLAKSKERDTELRAEALLERMEELSLTSDELKSSCRPDQVVSSHVILLDTLEKKTRD